MEYDILTVGFPLVEIMRKERDVPFDIVGDFTGPYPSGDTCIVLDVAARLGKKCCFFGPVGDDSFGKLVVDRLKADSVETGYMRIAKGYSTAAVFVRYSKNGEREYLDFINNSACVTLNVDDIIPEVVKSAKWVHFSGEIISNCLDNSRREAIMKLFNNISGTTKVSLDPNFTIELDKMEEIMQPFIDRADLILPSEGEARLLLGTKTDEEACRLLSLKGKIVALKKGKNGCDIYENGSFIHVNPFNVKEVDPTGCGDSFGAGFITGLLEGLPMNEVGRFANATGALQATALGPMEGAKYYYEVNNFIINNSNT